MNRELFKILLVDDRQENLMTLEHILDSPDLVLLKAMSGNDALALLLEHDIALVLMDVQMPGMDGFEVAEIMRSRERTRSIPIIFITAISKERKHIFRGYDAGAVDYLYKPLDIEILRSKIRAYIELFKHRHALQLTTIQLSQTVKELEHARQIAEEATQAKSIFLATMSHEIRTPLNGIIGMAELMLTEELSQDQEIRAKAVKESGESLLEIINDILDLSKIEAGRLELENISFDLGEVCRKTLNIIKIKTKEKNLALHVAFSPALPEKISGDPVRIRQILMNLLSNAVKFTPQGSISLKVELIPSATRQNLLFTIADTGIGIEADKVEQLFDTYRQAEKSTTRKFGGTGLGLFITRKLVQLLEGTLRLESEPGKGTTFFVEIPLACQSNEPFHSMPSISSVFFLGKAEDEISVKNYFDYWNIPVATIQPDQPDQSHLKPMVLIIDAELPGAGDYWSRLPANITTDITSRTVFLLADEIKQARNLANLLGINHFNYLEKPFIGHELFKQLTGVATHSSFHLTEPPILAPTEKRRLRILLAEDQEINRRIAITMLEKIGHHVEPAENGIIAVDKFIESHYDLILMDVQMPESDGYEATQRIREIEKATGNHIPIIAMTAHAMMGDREKSLNSGMDAHITKPFKMAELYKTIDELI